MDVVIVYNQVENRDTVGLEAADDTVICAQKIQAELTKLGVSARLFKLTNGSIPLLEKLKTDVFFNLAWGIGEDEESEEKVITLLRKTKIPITGSYEDTVKITSNKKQTKNVLKKAGIKVPQDYIYSGGKLNLPPSKLNFPFIVKPAGEDCSLGITGKSVVYTFKTLLLRVKEAWEEFNEPILIEEYIEGRELNVSVLEDGSSTKVLPISEIVFGPYFSHRHHIVDYEAKWNSTSVRYKQTKGVCPAKLPKEIEKKVSKIAICAYKIIGCRNYARVDIRLNKEGEIYVLEVNSNPADRKSVV